MAGATDMRTGQKNGFAHPSMGGELIILDPALTASTPERIWLSTGVRAIDHCVEGLCSLDPRAIHHEAACVEGLKLLIPSLLHTRKNWEAKEPRLNSMLGVIESTRSIRAGVPMGGSHGIGHQLGPLGVGHGETSCILLPAVLKYNYRHGDGKVKGLQMKLLDVFWNDKTIAQFLDGKGMKKGTADAGDILRAVFVELGMPTTLKDVHVKRAQVDDLANNSLRDTWLQTNAVPLTTKEQVLDILQGIIE
jgi:alcohol dehydrogenase class IV